MATVVYVKILLEVTVARSLAAPVRAALQAETPFAASLTGAGCRSGPVLSSLGLCVYDFTVGGGGGGGIDQMVGTQLPQRILLSLVSIGYHVSSAILS